MIFRARARVLLLLFFAALILTLQIAGGAYGAEFNFYADEAGQFVSGLMIHDYITHFPAGDPLEWACRYYLHYPQIAIGRWPPGFPVLEALWFLIFGASRASALALLALMVWASAALFYNLATRVAPWWPAATATVLLLVCPVVAFSFQTVMADAPCLLASVLFLQALSRLPLRPSRALAAWLVVIVLFGLSIKGTALCFVPAPFIALTGMRKTNFLRSRLLLGVAAGAAFILLSCYLAAPSTFVDTVGRLGHIGGVGFRGAWGANLIFQLTGYGVCLLAAGGVYYAATLRDPIAVAAASLIASSLAVSFVMRAMHEPRHWIIVVPALLLLALECASRIALASPWKLALVAALALAFFPFRFLHQQPAGYNAFLRNIPHPARLLVSSTELEGPWVAAVAAREPRPSSTVIRATKTLASEDWDANHYRLLTETPEAVTALLDRFGVDYVAIYTDPATPPQPHHILLARAMATSASWQLLASNPPFQAWRRIKPPAYPREPLTIDLRSRIGRIITESSK